MGILVTPFSEAVEMVKFILKLMHNDRYSLYGLIKNVILWRYAVSYKPLDARKLIKGISLFFIFKLTQLIVFINW